MALGGARVWMYLGGPGGRGLEGGVPRLGTRCSRGPAGLGPPPSSSQYGSAASNPLQGQKGKQGLEPGAYMYPTG